MEFLGKLDDIGHDVDGQELWDEKKSSGRSRPYHTSACFKSSPPLEKAIRTAFRQILSKTTVLDTEGERAQTELRPIGNR